MTSCSPRPALRDRSGGRVQQGLLLNLGGIVFGHFDDPHGIAPLVFASILAGEGSTTTVSIIIAASCVL